MVVVEWPGHGEDVMAHKLLVLATLAGILPLLAGAAFAAGGDGKANATEIDLLGKDPGKAAAYSCFTRQYDDAHLAAHPRQNVRAMSLFVESTYDASNDPDNPRTDDIQIGVNFRKLAKAYDISGGCDTTVDNKKLLSCGGDCDGGHFDISTKGPDTILVSIPDGARLWDPDADPNADPQEPPKAAQFGADDKLFMLNRVDVKQCQALMSDDAKLAIFGTPLPKP